MEFYGIKLPASFISSTIFSRIGQYISSHPTTELLQLNSHLSCNFQHVTQLIQHTFLDQLGMKIYRNENKWRETINIELKNILKNNQCNVNTFYADQHYFCLSTTNRFDELRALFYEPLDHRVPELVIVFEVFIDPFMEELESIEADIQAPASLRMQWLKGDEDQDCEKFLVFLRAGGVTGFDDITACYDQVIYVVKSEGILFFVQSGNHVICHRANQGDVIVSPTGHKLGIFASSDAILVKMNGINVNSLQLAHDVIARLGTTNESRKIRGTFLSRIIYSFPLVVSKLKMMSYAGSLNSLLDLKKTIIDGLDYSSVVVRSTHKKNMMKLSQSTQAEIYKMMNAVEEIKQQNRPMYLSILKNAFTTKKVYPTFKKFILNHFVIDENVPRGISYRPSHLVASEADTTVLPNEEENVRLSSLLLKLLPEDNTSIYVLEEIERDQCFLELVGELVQANDIKEMAIEESQLINLIHDKLWIFSNRFVSVGNMIKRAPKGNCYIVRVIYNGRFRAMLKAKSFIRDGDEIIIESNHEKNFSLKEHLMVFKENDIPPRNVIPTIALPILSIIRETKDYRGGVTPTLSQATSPSSSIAHGVIRKSRPAPTVVINEEDTLENMEIDYSSTSPIGHKQDASSFVEFNDNEIKPVAKQQVIAFHQLTSEAHKQLQYAHETSLGQRMTPMKIKGQCALLNIITNNLDIDEILRTEFRSLDGDLMMCNEE